LHSQSVDGASIKIPDRLRTPPEAKEPYIIDILTQAASEFVDAFNASEATSGAPLETTSDDVDATICQLLQNPQNALSEYELFDLTCNLAKKHSLDYRKYLGYLDLGALSTPEKYAVCKALGLTSENNEDAFLWNSLFRSDIVNRSVLYQKRLDKPYNLQRLYSSKIQGLQTFFYYLRMATQEFTRKLLILKA
jgi:regulator of nonsense transcripts 1